jgi:hypothetical protein
VLSLAARRPLTSRCLGSPDVTVLSRQPVSAQAKAAFAELAPEALN